MSEYPNLDLFHARMNEIPEWGRKMIGNMLIKLEEESQESSQLRSKLEAAEKEAEYYHEKYAEQNCQLESNTQECCACSKHKEGLQAQVAMLRGALGKTKLSILEANRKQVIQDGFYDLIIFGIINPVLETTSAEATERVQGLVEALKRICGDYICGNCENHTVRSGDDYEKPSMFCELRTKEFRDQDENFCERFISDGGSSDSGKIAQQALAKYRGEVGV